MAALRAVLILATILAFFLVGAPLQWLASRRAAGRAYLIPAHAIPAHVIPAHVIPRLFCRTLLRLCRVRVAITGTQAHGRPAGRPVLAAANHVSWIDILALGTITPYCFLAKSDVAGWPIVSAFAEVQGTVFVDRGRRRSIVPANRRLAERMLAGRTALLFPEGTTVAGPHPGPFRSSHFAAARDALAIAPAHEAVDVQPIAIAYSSPAAAWVGDDALLPHVWRILRGRPLTCAITFGTPIAFAPGSDRKAVARQARAAVIELLASRATAVATEPARHEIGTATAARAV